MASNSRRQIEAWLATLEVEGSVIDFGGLFWPIKGRTKTWQVSDYRILDQKPSRKGFRADYVYDLNQNWVYHQLNCGPKFDVGFCIEVTDHLWNPVQAFTNMWAALKPGGLLYISANFLFPAHTGVDCIRLTKTGLAKILDETGFMVRTIVPRLACDGSLLAPALDLESKVHYHRGEIGYMASARRI